MESIRTIVSVFARIILPGNKLLLAVNTGKLAEGKVVLGPLGGNQQYNSDYKEELVSVLSIDPNTGFERPDDLRLVIGADKVQKFIDIVLNDNKVIEPRKEAIYRELIEEFYTEPETRVDGLKEDAKEVFIAKPLFFSVTQEPELLISRTVFMVTIIDPDATEKIIAATEDDSIGLFAVEYDVLTKYLSDGTPIAISYKGETLQSTCNLNCKYMIDSFIPESNTTFQL
jgi:hypothetical protein